MADPNPGLVEQIGELWPMAVTTVASVTAWFTAGWRAKKVAEAKTTALIDDLREKAHQTELEIAQIRAVLSAATGLKFEQITLDMVRDMVSRQSVTLQEVETFILTMPRLMWIKKRVGVGSFKMIQVSQVYADKYLGGDASSYTNKHDTEVWPEDVAAYFAVNDEAAFLSGNVIDIDEPVYSPRTGVRGRFTGVKWSFSLGKDHYVCGLGVHQASEVVRDEQR